MKILTQNFKNGKLSVDDYPFPALPPNGALVATTFSAVSLGTERAVYNLAKATPWRKAKRRPDLVRQVLNRARNEGILDTFQVVRNLMNNPVPLGYSACGTILQTGYRCDQVEPGDRVACAGFEYAHHAEVNAVPRNMMARIPAGVSDEEACFATVASVALHAIRLADVRVGETILIAGMGLLGHLCAALAEIQGGVVAGFDPSGWTIESARKYCPRGQYFASIEELAGRGDATDGRGFDHAFICSTRADQELFRSIAELLRERGQLMVVGDVECSLPRRLFYQKEIQVKFPRAYGPGRYDPEYERKGVDYPIGYVRWTLQRNMQEILSLMGQKKLSIAPLITHRFQIGEADKALEALFEKPSERAMGVVIDYPGAKSVRDAPVILDSAVRKSTEAGPILGIIGAGRFAQAILIPAFKKAGVADIRKIATDRGLSAVSAGKKFGAAQAVSSPEEIIRDPEIDTILVATRHGDHAELICAGLGENKNVFSEKPLALNTGDVGRIIEAERKSKGILMIGFNRRFSPFLVRLQRSLSFSEEPVMLLYRINAGAQPPEAWVHDPGEGGGRIIGEVCHYVDVANFLIQSAPKSLYSCSLTGRKENQTYYDSVSLTLKYENGSVANVVFTANGNARFPKEYLEAHRDGASGFLYNYRKMIFQHKGRPEKFKTFSQQKGFLEEAAAFCEGCRTGAAPISMEEMALTTRITFAAMHSLSVGEAVDLEEISSFQWPPTPSEAKDQ